MYQFLVTLLTVIILSGCGEPSQASVYVFAPGTSSVYTIKTDIVAFESAADCMGKVGVISSPVTLTTAVTHKADRGLQITKGGLITTSGAGSLTFAPGATLDCGDGSYQVFGGTMAVTGLSWATPDMFGISAGAVSYAISASKKVELRKGITYISASIAYNDDITLFGGGTLKHVDNSLTPLISSSGGYIYNIKDITIDGNQANQSVRFPTVLITGSVSVLMSDVTVINGNGVSEATTDGRAAITFVECSNAIVRNCKVSGSLFSGLMYKKLNGTVTNTYGNKIEGGTFSSNGGSGIVTYFANDVTIDGITANSNGVSTSSSGISINGPNNKVVNCVSINNGSAGINVGHGVDSDLNASGSIVANNTCVNNIYSGITVLGDNSVIQSQVNITNNFVDASSHLGIVLPQYALKTSITGNIVQNASTAISVYGEQHLISNNTLSVGNTSPISINASTSYVGQDMTITNNIINEATQPYVHYITSGSGIVRGVLTDGYLIRTSPNSTLTGTTAKTIQFSIPIRSWHVYGPTTKFIVRASGLKTGVSAKTIRVEMGAAGSGAGIVNQVVSTTNAWDLTAQIQMVSSNIGHIQSQVWDGATKSTDTFFTQTFGVNFGDTFFVELYFTLANASESITLSNYSIELLR